jgi:hypothetical protein
MKGDVLSIVRSINTVSVLILENIKAEDYF